MANVPLTTADVAAVFSAVAAWGSLFAVVGGLFFANRQLNSWRHQEKARREAEVAEFVYVAAHEAADAVRRFRVPYRRFSVRDGEDSSIASRRDISERINQAIEPFQVLRKADLRAKVVLRSSAIEASIKEILDVRWEAAIAHQELQSPQDYDLKDPEQREEFQKYRRSAYASGGDADILSKRLEKALSTLQSELETYTSLGFKPT